MSQETSAYHNSYSCFCSRKSQDARKRRTNWNTCVSFISAACVWTTFHSDK